MLTIPEPLPPSPQSSATPPHRQTTGRTEVKGNAAPLPCRSSQHWSNADGERGVDCTTIGQVSLCPPPPPSQAWGRQIDGLSGNKRVKFPLYFPPSQDSHPHSKAAPVLPAAVPRLVPAPRPGSLCRAPGPRSALAPLHTSLGLLWGESRTRGSRDPGLLTAPRGSGPLSGGVAARGHGPG